MIAMSFLRISSERRRPNAWSASRVRKTKTIKSINSIRILKKVVKGVKDTVREGNVRTVCASARVSGGELRAIANERAVIFRRAGIKGTHETAPTPITSTA